MKKQKIPSSLRQMVWVTYNREVFRAKCQVSWCQNIITPFTFEVGHNKPESKGGKTTIDNLLPICSSCNKSMGNTYTITEYSNRFKKRQVCFKDEENQNHGVLWRFMKKFGCIKNIE